MTSVSIVVPAYEEEAAIGAVVDALRALPVPSEIIVVDDGSSDRTGAVAAEHGARVIRRPDNGGYGRSIKDGVEAASSDTIVITDADGTYPIAVIPTLLQKKGEGFDMVVGARQGRVYRGSFFKRVGRFFLQAIVEYATGTSIPDVNSGLRVFSKRIVEPLFPDICDGFSFSTTITLVHHLTHRMVAYVPIAYERRTGTSKVRHMRDTLRTLQYITECLVRYNPLKLTILFVAGVLIVGLLGSMALGASILFQSFFTAVLIAAMGCIAEALRRPRR